MVNSRNQSISIVVADAYVRGEANEERKRWIPSVRARKENLDAWIGIQTIWIYYDQKRYDDAWYLQVEVV
jgi:hypothetical protein